MLIIVAGLPGSGKTYFASRLAQKLDATYFSSDRTRVDIDAQGKYAFEDKMNVYEEMVHRAARELRAGKSVVVDATFYRKEMRQIFLTLAKLLHVRVKIIQIVADEEVIRGRLSKPRQDSEAGLAVYRLVKSQYQAIETPHQILESTADNIDDMLSRAMDYISRQDEEDDIAASG